MKLFFISSGTKTLSYLDPNIISAFRQIERNVDLPFTFNCFHSDKENIQTLYNRVQKFNPDIIISLNRFLTPETIQQLKRLNIPIGLWVVDDPYLIKHHLKIAQMYHFVVTEDSGSVPVYRRKKMEVLHLPLAVNPNYYYPMEVPKQYQYDICFVGSALPIRLKMIDDMAVFLKGKNFIIIGRWWERLKNYALLKPHILNRTIPPNEVAKYYNGAKIVLNIHRTCNDVQLNPQKIPAHTPNNRTFDIAACKAFQLATCRKDLDKYFDINDEIICYQGVHELKDKINYYLQNEEERQNIAENAYQRTMEQHTYVHRLKELIQMIKNNILVHK
ncbi:glycosyltransferase [Neobacillus mesonae]|uniref:CgeB family protein n=1 Tax=Neobacillus mesonae TaxID=1193713 RepID=UPI002E202165|nr:glycosyltransferase [Neobacillus mesonae]